MKSLGATLFAAGGGALAVGMGVGAGVIGCGDKKYTKVKNKKIRKYEEKKLELNKWVADYKNKSKHNRKSFLN